MHHNTGEYGTNLTAKLTEFLKLCGRVIYKVEHVITFLGRIIVSTQTRSLTHKRNFMTSFFHKQMSGFALCECFPLDENGVKAFHTHSATQMYEVIELMRGWACPSQHPSGCYSLIRFFFLLLSFFSSFRHKVSPLFLAAHGK